MAWSWKSLFPFKQFCRIKRISRKFNFVLFNICICQWIFKSHPCLIYQILLFFKNHVVIFFQHKGNTMALNILFFFKTDTAEHSSLSHCIIWVVIKPQLQGCMGTRQFSLMNYRSTAVEVKQVDIHLEVAMWIYHNATKEIKGTNNEAEF